MDLFKMLIDGLLGIAFFIDKVVYSFIPILYRLLLYLANVDLVTGNVPVQALIQRIYILVGVFMLFKLSFSVMNYIVDPDAFSDKSKGFSNLVKRVLLAVVLLVGIPWVFREAYVIQGKILTSGILPRLVLGEAMASDQDSLEDTMDTSAVDVQFMLFGPFFSLNYNSDSGDLIDCKPSPDYPTSNVLGTNGMASNDNCMNTVAALMDDDSDVSASGVTLRDFFRYEENGIQDNRKFESFGGLISWTLSNGNRAINYYPIASTLCGGYLVFLLLSFCIDIAARMIRMFFLQILSPIAVISSIDPTTNGDSLKEWAKECVKVWASLFLRLLVIFLIIQLVRIVSNTIYSGSIFDNNGGDVNMWIYVFLILGIFQAAKSIPELIEKATGIKMSGDLQLNPFKALKENAGVGLGLAGLGIGATAIASGATNIGAAAYESYRNHDERGVGARLGLAAGRGILSGVGGFFGGGYRSLRGAMNGEKGMKNFSNAFGSAMFARQQREDLNRQGSTWPGRLMADVNRHLGIMNDAQRQELDYARDNNRLQQIQSFLDNRKRRIAQEKEDATRDFSDYSNAISAIDQMINNRKEVTDAEKMYEEAKATGDDRQIAAAQQLIDDAKRQEFRKMLTDQTDQNHQRLMAYQAEIERLRNDNATIASYGNPIDSANATFSKTSMYAAQDEIARVEYEYSMVQEREQAAAEAELAQAKADLESRKSTAVWQSNELDNSSRGVKSPQPEGWKPSGEISGAYGPQYGPGVWGHRGGNNGHRP